MTKFSVFTIYEKEMRIVINALKEHSAIDIEKLSEWLYETGMTVFQKSQAALYYPYVAECQKKFNHRPLISYYHSVGQHYHAFNALKDALIQAFGGNNPEIINNSFDRILLPAIAAHSKFITLESQIASEFNEFMDKNGELTPVQSLEKVIGMFEMRQNEHTELQEDFKNKLTVMREVLAEMKKTVTAVKAPQEFFKAPPTELKHDLVSSSNTSSHEPTNG